MTALLDPCLAVVPARGGSKGLPGKNIRPLGGLPLLVHALRCAGRVDRIRRTVVSTDSEEIAAVARAAGGDVPFLRPAELAGDGTPTMPVLHHALLEAEKADGHRYESLLLLEPTSPGRLPEDLTAAFEALDRHPEADGAVGISQPSWNPFYVGVAVDGGTGLMKPIFDGTHTRRQDVPTFHRINGVVYLWRRDFLLRTHGSWLGGRHVPVLIPESRAFSIDDALEFEAARLMIENGLVQLPWLDGP